MPLSLIGLVGTLVVFLGLLGSVAYLKNQVAMYSARATRAEQVNLQNVKELEKLKNEQALANKAVANAEQQVQTRIQYVDRIKEVVRNVKAKPSDCTRPGPAVTAALNGLRSAPSPDRDQNGSGNSPVPAAVVPRQP